MTKAVVRAMDTVQAIFPNFKEFVVAGASKRGWTTWTTGIVDKRVKALVPIVIPILNIVPNIGHQYRAYGGWSFALDDYLSMGVMSWLNEPQFKALAAVVDPYSYLDRLTMPKYAICATGDEFFLPDSPQFFWDDLPGEKHLRMVPNAEHSLIGHALDISFAVIAFYRRVVHNKPLPRYSWTMEKANDTEASITVTTIDPPSAVFMYYAQTANSTIRDFRLIKCETSVGECFQPIFWFFEELEDQGNGVYVAKMAPPILGWVGFMVELQYEYEGIGDVFTVTTEVNVVPDRLPFPPCGDHCQP